jgi:hypothetical protein
MEDTRGSARDWTKSYRGEIVAKEVMEQLIPLVIPRKRRSRLHRLFWGD